MGGCTSKQTGIVTPVRKPNPLNSADPSQMTPQIEVRNYQHPNIQSNPPQMTQQIEVRNYQHSNIQSNPLQMGPQIEVRSYQPSNIQSNPPLMRPQLEVRSYQHPDIQLENNAIAIAEARNAIFKNDHWLVLQVFSKFKIPPNASLGQTGYGQTALHLAAMKNCVNSIRAILQFINQVQPGKTAFYLLIPDSDGNIPCMVAALHDAPEALVALLLVSMTLPITRPNNQGLNLFQIAQDKSLTCLNILNQMFGRKDQPSESLKNALLAKQQALAKLQQTAMIAISNAIGMKLTSNGNDEKPTSNGKSEEPISKGNGEKPISKGNDEKPNLKVNEKAISYGDEKPISKGIEKPISNGTLKSDGKDQKTSIEVLKLQTQITRANRTAEDVINSYKLQQNQTSTSLTLKYPSILAQFQGTTNVYQDPEFPAHLDSICVNKSHRHFEKYYKTAKWLRPHEFLKVDDYSEIKVFDGIDPNDIQQGILGVCYFLSSMASIAEFPSRLMKIFNTKEANPYGVYSVTVYNMGIPQEIIVDDRFPCYKSGKPMFSCPKGKELWTMILEKAWAKMYGNYGAIETGSIREAMISLLGAPAEEIQIDDETTADKVWADILSWDRENFIMGCTTKASVDRNKTGLISAHAYSVLAAYDVGGVRLLKLRNPWGKQEWTGDFSDKSPLWTDEAKRIVGYTDADDGIFCMTITDFFAMMSSYTVCYYKDNYFRSHQLIEATKKNAEYFEFELKETCETCITVMQKADRFFGKNSGYKASPVELILIKKEGNKYKRISKIFYFL